jgi:taurine dioxygenase
MTSTTTSDPILAAHEPATPLRSRRLAPGIGAEILDLDLRQPLEGALLAAFLEIWHAHNIVLLRGQSLTEDEQVRFAQQLGPLATTINKHDGHGSHPGVMYVSNVRKDGKLIGALPDGEMLFHSDQCYIERPCAATMLYAMEIPHAGGNTLFANMYKAYETLPTEVRRRIDGRRAMNVYDYANNPTQRGPAVAQDVPHYAHPMVRTHPATGRKALYVNRLMTEFIEDMPRDESDALLAQLFAQQERPEFIYEHVWRPGDLMLWDNRCTLHARTDFDASERRMLRRVIVLGEKPN